MTLFEGLRSERELVRVAADRLSVRWYLGYDLDEDLPISWRWIRPVRPRWHSSSPRKDSPALSAVCQLAMAGPMPWAAVWPCGLASICGLA